MVNFVQYDNINNTKNSDNYIVTVNRYFYSKTLPHYNYYSFVRRYDFNTKDYTYYIALSMDKDDKINDWKKVIIRNGKVAINLYKWFDFKPFNTIVGNKNVILVPIEEDDTGAIYEFIIC